MPVQSLLCTTILEAKATAGQWRLATKEEGSVQLLPWSLALLVSPGNTVVHVLEMPPGNAAGGRAYLFWFEKAVGSN
jgi:hypothetical protein